MSRLYRVTLLAHFPHYSGERRDVKLCHWVDAVDRGAAVERAKRKAERGRYRVDGVESVTSQEEIDAEMNPRTVEVAS